MGDERLSGELPDGGWVIDAGHEEPIYGPPKATPNDSAPAGEKKADDGAPTTWRWQPFVVAAAYLLLVAGPGYLAVVLLGWPSARHAAGWQTWATVAAGMVVAWYTWETRELRRTSQAQVAATLRQTEVQLRPFVVVRRTAEPGVFAVENVGQAVALNVRVPDVVVGKIHESPLTVHFPETVPVLRAGRPAKVRTQSFVGTLRASDDSGFSASLDEDFAKETLTVTVQYENVEGRTYAVPVTVAPKRATVGSVREGGPGPTGR